MVEKDFPLVLYYVSDTAVDEGRSQCVVNRHAGDHSKLSADLELADLNEKDERVERLHGPAKSIYQRWTVYWTDSGAPILKKTLYVNEIRAPTGVKLRNYGLYDR